MTIQEKSLPAKAEIKTGLAPVHATQASVAYLGVALPKAGNPENAPRREQYADYINDRFSLELQKKIAISWKQGDPILIEGGTSIGKTTAVKKMCADLGWEVHYVNLNGATDVEDFMGRYIPNHNRLHPHDPEYVFADGKITSGLRQEVGKRKVILLDEYNSAAPNIVIRLHEVLDALKRNGEVVLTEDASEKIQVDKEVTKVVGLMNPPGHGYFQREPLDLAQIRRWVYLKEANEMPGASLTHTTRALFHLEDTTEKVEDAVYLFANETPLTPEQFKEIPGIEVILDKYLEFHKGAKELLANRRIAKDQPQRFFFDDREEPKRVRDFISAFYRGDINETTQEALRYYYANKLLKAEDKQSLEELIRTVEYLPPGNSKRLALAADAAAKTSAAPLSGKGATLQEAERIFGRDLLGGKVVNKIFGAKLELGLPFSREELERAKALGQQLILQTDVMDLTDSGTIARGVPVTLENLKKYFPKAYDEAPLWYSQDWYANEEFYRNQRPRSGWRLTSKGLIPGSTTKSYLEQTDVLVEHVQNQIFKNAKLPKHYEDAIAEFKRKRAEIAPLARSRKDAEWKHGAQMLADLAITRLTRELPVEVMYRLILNDRENREKLLSSTYPWTASRDSGGRFVYVGFFGAKGASVGRFDPNDCGGRRGVSFSRG